MEAFGEIIYPTLQGVAGVIELKSPVLITAFRVDGLEVTLQTD